MNKSLICTTIVMFMLTGCMQKKEENKTSDTANKPVASAQEQQPVEEILPAMLARSFKVKLDQPRICQQDEDLDGMVCTISEVIGLKSNISWIEQIIDKEIRQEFAENLKIADVEQQKINKTEVEGMRNWSRSLSYQFKGQFGQYVQIEKTSYEYSGGAHGMAFFSDYIFDLKTKKRVQLKDIIVTGKQSALKEALWKAYENWCNDNDMEPFIKKEDFTISENFFINQKGGLTFDYQIYELGPYVAGPISLELYETNDLIRPEFLPKTPVFDQEY